VSRLLLDHYRLMARSGVALVVVENATVDHPTGSGSNHTLRADTDDNLEGLAKLAAAIKARERWPVCRSITPVGSRDGSTSRCPFGRRNLWAHAQGFG